MICFRIVRIPHIRGGRKRRFESAFVKRSSGFFEAAFSKQTTIKLKKKKNVPAKPKEKKRKKQKKKQKKKKKKQKKKKKKKKKKHDTKNKDEN